MRAFQSAFKLVQREQRTARPDERLHVELNRGVAVDGDSVVAVLGRGTGSRDIAPAPRATTFVGAGLSFR
jgi:hypothetical protein